MKIKNKIKNLTIEQKHYIILALVCLLSQGLLLLVSGRWWDDWCFYDFNLKQLWTNASQHGMPSFFLYRFVIAFLPEGSYRIISFVLFYFCSVFFYNILIRGFKVSQKDAVYISLLFLTLPAFDAKICKCIYPYTLGLFFFFAAFSLLLLLLHRRYSKTKTVLYRISDLLLFAFAFTLNSTLVFYIIPFCYIIYCKKIGVIKYVDYFFLPFIFFFCKNLFFPVWGIYQEYNKVTISRIVSAVMGSWDSCIKLFQRVFENYSVRAFLSIAFILLAFLVIIIVRFISKRKQFLSSSIHTGENKEFDIKKYFFMLLFGIITLAIGLFPYVVVRESSWIEASGTPGRDCILGLIGASIVIFSLVKIFVRERISKLVFVFFIINGILYFNSVYIDYQMDFYDRIALKEHLISNQNINNYKNIVYFSENENEKLDLTSWGVLNAVFYEAYGVQNKLVCDGFNNYKMMRYDEDINVTIQSTESHMKDYDVVYDKIDAVIIYSSNLSKRDFVKLKIVEVFNNESFKNIIKNNSTLKVIENGTNEFNEIVKENNAESIVKNE